MPLDSDICVKCKQPVKSTVTCGACKQHYHPSCARDYIKNKPLTHCCRKHLGHLLLSLDPPSATTRSRANLLKSTKTKASTSSVSSFKSVYSPSPPVSTSSTTTPKSLKSPITPNMSSTPGNDSVFSPPTPFSPATLLPEGWSEKSLDDKVTALMEKLLVSELTANQQFGNLRTQITELKDVQSKTADKLNTLSMNVEVNANAITMIDGELTNLKTQMETDKTLILEKLSALENSNSGGGGTSVPTASIVTQSSAELVISGIPDQIIKKLSPINISTAVNHLNLLQLINDVLNVRNLVSHVAQFLNLVHETHPDIIILTETWLKPSLNNQIFSLSDYTIVRRDRTLKHADSGRFIKGGGVACLIHNSLKVKALHISASDHINQPEFLIVDNWLTSLAIYRRPKGMFLTEFFDIHSKLAPNFKNIIIAGDLNCNLMENSYTTNHLKDFITESSLYCVPYGPTFHKNSCDSWLDVILLDNVSKLVSFTKSDTPFADGHDYLLCQYKIDQPHQISKKITFRNLKNCDHQALSGSIINSLKIENSLLEDSDPNELFSLFRSSVISSLDLHAPQLTKKVVRQSNPWFTKELKSKCKERDEIYKRAKRTHDETFLALYKAQRKNLKTEIALARELYLKTALAKLPSNSSVWSKLKHLFAY
ncbi:Protein of unknown function [Cotesia congregata]|uniref:Endonuclease/exonuclease/phosphatase domain-containing protein n=1 Tax=Cotesia congregata TaxID=51543 RepID=A0A8J2MTZ6_COTCN|nr:Protein of unknown function [Cotesia congregata]